MNFSNNKKMISSVTVRLFIVFAVFFAAIVIMSDFSSADAVDYIDNNYSGTITREDGADLFSEPGTVSPHITDADGNNVHIAYGTEVLILKEDFDPDLDMWYYCTATVDGIEYTGYLYSGRVTRGDPIAHTPTPTPSPDPATPTPELATSGNIQSGDIYQNDTEANGDTQSMIDDSKGFGPLIYIIILVIIIVAFMLIYTLYVRYSEEKLEREIERYSNRPQYEPIEGELEEDYEEAKSNYYDSIGLGAQANKDYDDLMANQEDMDLSMETIYANQSVSEEVQSGNASDALSDLIASLEKKLGNANEVCDYDDSEEEYPSEASSSADYDDYSESPAEDYDDYSENSADEYDEPSESLDDNAAADGIYFQDTEAESEGQEEAPEPEPIQEEATVEPIVVPEFLKKSSKITADSQNAVPAGAEAESPDEQNAVKKTAPADSKVAKLSFRTRLDQLEPKALILHRVYGKGVVVDNSDPDIIQVKFGSDMRFLKKDKLVEKKLVKLQK